MSEYEDISRARDKDKLKFLIKTLDRNAALAVKGEPYQKVGIRFAGRMECPYDEAAIDIIDETELFCNEGADGKACDFIDGDVFKTLLAQYLKHFTGVIDTDTEYKDVPKYKFSFGIKMVEGEDFDREQEQEQEEEGILQNGYGFILTFDFDQIEDMMAVIKSKR